MIEQSKKQSRVIEAALAAFMRYGFKRVTMGDIAKEAGMSRPALYLVFPGKEQIFAAVVRHFTERALGEIKAGLPHQGSLEQQLRFVFDIWTVRPFKLIHELPDARDLVDCSAGFAQEVVDQGYREFEGLLVSLLESHADRIGGRRLTPPRLAHMMASSARGFKGAAQDEQELRELIATLIVLVQATLLGGGQPAPGAQGSSQ